MSLKLAWGINKKGVSVELALFYLQNKTIIKSMEREQKHVELIKTIGDHEFSFTYDNTMIMLFGNAILNHVYMQQDDGTSLAIYDDGPFLDELHEAGFPQYSRTDDPEWAEERAVGAMFGGIDYEP